LSAKQHPVINHKVSGFSTPVYPWY